MRVTDCWSGDREWLLKTFPGESLGGPDDHEHAHHDGCFYHHEHEAGRHPHEHIYKCDNEIHGPGRSRECIMPPRVADPDAHRTESRPA